MGYRVFLFLHRWSGIAAAALAVVIGLTGSLLVVRDGLDRALNPDLLNVVPRAERLTLDELAARIAAADPQARVNAVVASEDPTRAWMVRAGPRTFYVDPYTGDIKGVRTRGEVGFDRRGFVPLVFGLHHDLLLEAPGHWIVAGTGLVWLVLSLVGIYLSIRQAGGLAAAFRVRTDVNLKRFFVDLHRSLGMASVALVAVLCVSGIYLAVRQPATRLVSAFSPVTPPPERALPDVRVAHPVGFDPAIDAVRSASPGARVHSVFAVPAKGVYRVRVTYPEERFFYVSMQEGAITQVRVPRQGTAGDVFVGWQKPLHTGEAFGPVGEAVVFVAGLLPLLFSITGLYLWLKNRRPARRGSPSVKTRQQPSGSQRSATSTNPQREVA